jgi:hypothetical protein
MRHPNVAAATWLELGTKESGFFTRACACGAFEAEGIEVMTVEVRDENDNAATVQQSLIRGRGSEPARPGRVACSSCSAFEKRGRSAGWIRMRIDMADRRVRLALVGLGLAGLLCAVHALSHRYEIVLRVQGEVPFEIRGTLPLKTRIDQQIDVTIAGDTRAAVQLGRVEIPLDETLETPLDLSLKVPIDSTVEIDQPITIRATVPVHYVLTETELDLAIGLHRLVPHGRRGCRQLLRGQRPVRARRRTALPVRPLHFSHATDPPRAGCTYQAGR